VIAVSSSLIILVGLLKAPVHSLTRVNNKALDICAILMFSGVVSPETCSKNLTILNHSIGQYRIFYELTQERGEKYSV